MTLRPTSKSERRNGLVLVLRGFPAIPAAELVVDEKHGVAADTNSGTAAKPFRTISAAAAKAAPGDYVLIHGGEYRETVIIYTSGSDKVLIVFEAVPGETPIIKGSLGADIRNKIVLQNRLRRSLGRRSIKNVERYAETISFIYRKSAMKYVFPKWGSSIHAILMRPK